MNLITLDLGKFDNPEFVGSLNANISHIGVWLKLISYAAKSDELYGGRLRGAAKWGDEEWLTHAGMRRDLVLTADNRSVCHDLWRVLRSDIEVYEVEVDKTTGNAIGMFQNYSNYDCKRRLADEALRSASLRKAVLAKTGGTCTYCGSDFDICVDHIVPVKAGGCNSIDNLQPLCRSCNSSKGAKMEYHSNVGMLLREDQIKQQQ